jgi:hypothetical protein
MLADLDETIRQILIKELPVKNGEIDIKFEQPKREWSARLSKPTVNLFLYDLRENNVLRQNQWEHVREENGTYTKKRSPMRVDCFYMLTTWASDPEDEHRLLTRSIMALYRYPILPEDRLVGSMRNPLFDIQARLAAHDRLTNPAEVWASLDNEMRPSVSYVVSLALDPWSEVTGPAVRTFTFQVGQSLAPDREQKMQAGGEGTGMLYFGGTLRSKADGHVPISGIRVAIKGTGLFTATDGQGRYRLGGLPAGDYILVIWPSTGKPVEKPVTLPAEAEDYDVWI